MKYHVLEEVKHDRRLNKSLSEIINKLFQSPSLFKENENLFEIIQHTIARVTLVDFVDMTTEAWGFLSVERQIEYARAYQKWYARQLNQEIEKTFFIKETEISMMLIPPGKFWRGSSKREKKIFDEHRHKVLISKPFWCGKFPITQEQWRAVKGENPSKFTDYPKLPVERVSWEDCQQFCQMTEMSFLTEAQWEYACRAGTTATYNFAEDISKLYQYAWYENNSGNLTRPVGAKKANAFGLYDMYGNVREWCQDIYGKYSIKSQIDPQGPLDSLSSYRVNRGGSWNSAFNVCDSSSRYKDTLLNRSSHLGFRVCRSL